MDAPIRSLRRSRDRHAIARAARRLGEADLPTLASAARVRVVRARWAIDGDGRYYRRGLALRRVGILEERRRGDRRTFRLTPIGKDALSRMRRAQRANGPVPAT